MSKIEAKFKDLKGNVIIIGTYADSLIKKLEKNDSVTSLTILGEEKILKKTKVSKLSKNNKQKIIGINDFRKTFKKNKVDYIICDYSKISKYIKKFVKDSIYICKGKIIYTGEFNAYKLNKMYKRYDTKITEQDRFIEIDLSKAKNKPFLEKMYYIGDLSSEISDLISDVLVK